MANSLKDRTKNMLGNIGAMQTLTENFPLNVLTDDENLQFNTSFDVLEILFKILNISREETIQKFTDFLCGLTNAKNDNEGTGVIANIESIVKTALYAKLSNVLNCTTNPIIADNLMDNYNGMGSGLIGEGITLNVSEIDFTGVLNHNPLSTIGSNFYFDVEDYNANTLWKSNDFNAFLWYIINCSNNLQTTERIWDNRYQAGIWGDKKDRKEIITCEYVDDEAGNTDKIRIHLCSSNYYKKRQLEKKDGTVWSFNKTVFEFNHDFLQSIKLYDPKVIVSEIAEQFLGKGGLNVNLGLSINTDIIQNKVNKIIENVIAGSDNDEGDDCFFSFSNEEYNEMLETTERKHYNIIKTENGLTEINPVATLLEISDMPNGTLNENKNIIGNALNQFTATIPQDSSSKVNIKLNWSKNWEFELMRMFAYPLIRPLFTPKVLFILMVNQKIMGSFEDTAESFANISIDDILKTVYQMLKEIIVKLKDLVIDFLLEMIINYLKPLIELFASKLLLETLKMYKDLLQQLLDACAFGWGDGRVNEIDNVNYADIIPVQTQPEQAKC